jgi:gamma-tubulin complex component 2
MQIADATTISFGNKVALRNLRDGNYLYVNKATGQITTTGIHPCLSPPGSDGIQDFIILNALNKESKGLITFGAHICLMTNDNAYLTFNASKEVRVEQIESAASSKLMKWTINDSNNSSSRRPVCCYDDITLKSTFGELITDENSVVYSRGQGTTVESTWKIMKSTVPYIPDWVFTRPSLDHNLLVLSRNPQPEAKQLPLRRRAFIDDTKRLAQLPLIVQEQTLIEDLLFSLNSIEGVYIRRKLDQSVSGWKKYVYAVEPYLDSPSCEESLMFMVNKILPLCSQHDAICVFTNVHSHYDFGVVNHALCEAIKSLMKEYRLRLTQLDAEHQKGDMTLQKLWYYLQPCMRTLDCLYKLVNDAENLKGGALLNSIYNFLISSTDPTHKQLFQYLMEQTSTPYLSMLSNWIHYGIIDDPYEEFMIIEKKEITRDNINKDYNDAYWRHRFVLREDSQIPGFLLKFAQKILSTGKYLNVIRECEKVIDCPYTEELNPKKNTKLLSALGSQREFVEPIEHAYVWASERLLSLIINEEQLMYRLKSIKHYFFLDIGDFFVHFMDSAQEELEKNVKIVSSEKLESLLEMSLRTSSANADPFKDDLFCEMQSFTLLEQVFAMQNIMRGAGLKGIGGLYPIYAVTPNYKGLETFVIDYKVRWPLTLIIGRNALTKYQLIFRHLFFCKYVERQLCTTWQHHQSTKELELQAIFSSSYCLRQRMLHFVKNYIYYLVVEVLEQKWHNFQQALNSVATIDNIMNHHNTFLDECLKESLIMDPELFHVLHKIISICSNFSETIQVHTKSMKLEDELLGVTHIQFTQNRGKTSLERRQIRIQEESLATRKVIAQKRYSSVISQYTQKFDELLNQFMNTIHSG